MKLTLRTLLRAWLASVLAPKLADYRRWLYASLTVVVSSAVFNGALGIIWPRAVPAWSIRVSSAQWLLGVILAAIGLVVMLKGHRPKPP